MPKLELWESAVREKPRAAETCGPPNWLICEEWKGKEKEPFEAAAARVKRRYFPEMSQENVPAADVPGELSQDVPGNICGDCAAPIDYEGTRCYACKKKRQRKLQETQ